ncbi:MAG: cyclic nucleotide-binding domain-containing protein [Candidatus Roizmanbacteria bacterium]|nr:cyclic nucleotide-binding domain-containing protein [Candidatus Roizmanbacteria bacterium]
MDNKEKLWNQFFDNQNKDSFTQALESLMQLKEIDPQNPLIFLKMGDLYQKINKVDKAVSAYYEAAGILEDKGFKNKAVALYKMMLRIDPGNPLALKKITETVPEIKPVSCTLQPKEQPGSVAPQTEISLLGSLSRAEIDEFTTKAEKHFLKKDSIIVKEGDTGRSLYVVKNGTLKVITNVMGKTIDIGCLYEGDIFGEIAFLTGRPRTATVIASTDAEVMEVNEPLLREIIKKHPEIDTILRRFYESRIQDTVQKIRVELSA